MFETVLSQGLPQPDGLERNAPDTPGNHREACICRLDQTIDKYLNN